MKLRDVFLRSLLLMVLLTGTCTRAQVVNGGFELGTPTPNQFNCNQTPFGWTCSSSPSAVQWENRWSGSWWIDLTDCSYGNGRWIEQGVPTIPGKTYIVGFDLGCWNGLTYTDAGADLYINGSLIGRFAHTDFSGSPMVWKHFEYCFIATTNITTIRFVGNGFATSSTPSWASPVSSWTGVIGLDNVSLTGQANFSIFASDTCVPALLGPNTSLAGSANWYLNGTLISSGPDTIVGTVPGHYTIVYTTACGTYTADTTLKRCDTCIVKMTSKYYCFRDSTIFTFNPPVNCLNPDCIGQINIDYGDGGNDFSPFGPVRFAHQYPGPGIYTVKYCWQNKCTGEVICDSFTIEIKDCGECWIKSDFNFTNCIPVQFTNKSTSNYHVLSTFWDFGDGNTSTANNPNHAYTSPGTYVVCLTIVTAGPNGTTCKMTICKTINVRFCGDSPQGGARIGKIGDKKGIPNNDNIKITDYANIRVFPNPTNDNVSISGILFDNETVTIYLYDITGRLLHKESVEQGKDEIPFPTKDLDRGAYILKVKGGTYSREIKLIKE